ncbi:YihY/virulence factor BrkB family protein [Nocardioides sp. SR21]|uniref:YihY/virulence factor BrkB family protein n=1 Tax=Nocardioides sp. SR21 TaxID=2919501 RepID=UPI001FA9DAEB|nr:YihY/virulence factor BrkB family protein [Nocardioides sp. SR21]
MARVIDAVDDAQRRWSVFGYPLGVIYKYFDDQGNYLAAIITYYAFIAIFPLLLLGSTILGFFLEGDPERQQELLDSALAQFPIIGDQLGTPEGLTGSTTVIIVGSLVALYGALGLGQALQNTLNVAWGVPRNSRPNPVMLRLKSLFLLVTAGVAMLAISALSILVSHTEVFGESLSSYRWPIIVLTVTVNTLVLTALFRVGAARSHSIWTGSVPGAVVSSLLWVGLQSIGALYVTNVITKTTGMNQTFALVLGLIGVIWLAAAIGVFGIEVNVVLDRRLWPRALLTPFTDRVRLTEADQRAYASYARAQRHKGFETVEVTFTDSMKLRVVQREPDDDADHAS